MGLDNGRITAILLYDNPSFVDFVIEKRGILISISFT